MPFSLSLLPADLAALVSTHTISATYETVALRVSAGYLGDEAYTGYDDALCGGFADEVWETWLFQRVYVG
jgi:hypothetical protein